MILDPGLELEPRAGIDGPWLDGGDRSADVVGGKPAREHDAPFGLGGSAPVLGIVVLPGKVEDGADRLAVTEQHGVTAAVVAVALVELVE